MGTSSGLALFLILLMLSSGTVGLIIKSADAQSATPYRIANQEVKQTVNQTFTLVPEGYFTIQIQLEINDHLEGQFKASNFHYYPNYYIGGHGELITYMINLDIHFQGQELYNSNLTREGTFNFTAMHQGIYTIRCYCSYIYLVKNPDPPKLAINYIVTGTPMEVNILSPSDQTYKVPNASLSYTVNRFGDWMGYCLDGEANVTLWDIDSGAPMSYGNSTLTGLSEGAHTLTVYANDTYGSMDSKTVSFMVDTTDYLSIVTTATVIAFVGITLATLVVVFYRKRRHPQSAVAGI